MLNDVATMTLAATAFTLPVLAISFHRVSLAAPLANLFAVPAFVAVAATSGLASVAGLVLPGDAAYLSWLAWPPAAYLIAVVQLFADLPVASVELRGVHVEHAIAYYALLGAAIWWLLPAAASAHRTADRGGYSARPSSRSCRRTRGSCSPIVGPALARRLPSREWATDGRFPRRRPGRRHPHRRAGGTPHPR